MRACIAAGNLRDACVLVKAWDLTAKFPGLQSQYQQRTMQRLLGKSLWSAAAGYAIGNLDFQVGRPYLCGYLRCIPAPASCKLVLGMQI